jgi:hypothetical protein
MLTQARHLTSKHWIENVCNKNTLAYSVDRQLRRKKVLLQRPFDLLAWQKSLNCGAATLTITTLAIMAFGITTPNDIRHNGIQHNNA